MAKYVYEVMNSSLFSVEPDSPRDAALDFVLALGITACPVIDEAGKLLGMVSLRDLMIDHGSNRVRDRIFEPAITIAHSAEIEAAARMLSREQVHRLVAVDDKGRAVGMVSAVDLVSALIGEPIHHPGAFHRLDPNTGQEWSEDLPLTPEQAGLLPEQPGVLALIYGAAGKPDLPIWAEPCDDLRARAQALLRESAPGSVQATYALERDRRHLRMRYAVAPDPQRRKSALESILERSRRLRGV